MKTALAHRATEAAVNNCNECRNRPENSDQLMHELRLELVINIAVALEPGTGLCNNKCSITSLRLAARHHSVPAVRCREKICIVRANSVQLHV